MPLGHPLSAGGRFNAPAMMKLVLQEKGDWVLASPKWAGGWSMTYASLVESSIERSGDGEAPF